MSGVKMRRKDGTRVVVPKHDSLCESGEPVFVCTCTAGEERKRLLEGPKDPEKCARIKKWVDTHLRALGDKMDTTIYMDTATYVAYFVHLGVAETHHFGSPGRSYRGARVSHSLTTYRRRTIILVHSPGGRSYTTLVDAL